VADLDASAGKESRITRLRGAHPWLDHLIRANDSYGDNYGNHYAAAITYFSVLSLIPILMVGFAIAGVVLAGNTHLLGELQSAIAKSVPGQLGTTLRDVINEAIKARGTVGVIGLVIALYSGVGWMGNLRDALTAQWGQERGKLPLLKTMAGDLLALIGLALALAVSIAVTVAGTGVGSYLIRLAGLDQDGWAHVLLVVLTVVLGLAANWLVFLWVIARLPRERVGVRSAVRGALLAAVGFEVLKQGRDGAVEDRVPFADRGGVRFDHRVAGVRESGVPVPVAGHRVDRDREGEPGRPSACGPTTGGDPTGCASKDGIRTGRRRWSAGRRHPDRLGTQRPTQTLGDAHLVTTSANHRELRSTSNTRSTGSGAVSPISHPPANTSTAAGNDSGRFVCSSNNGCPATTALPRRTRHTTPAA
jgi:membrane protein